MPPQALACGSRADAISPVTCDLDTYKRFEAVKHLCWPISEFGATPLFSVPEPAAPGEHGTLPAPSAP